MNVHHAIESAAVLATPGGHRAPRAAAGALLASTMLAAALVLGAGQASAAESLQFTPPVWGGPQQDHVDILIQYDNSASGPLVIGPYPFVLGASGTSWYYLSCGSTRQGVLMPGESCALRMYFNVSTGAVVGKVTFSDDNDSGGNIAAFVRAAMEVRDSSDHTLVHAELR